MADQEITVVIDVHRGLVQDVGTLARDVPRLNVILIDRDGFQYASEEASAESVKVTALEGWARYAESALIRGKDALPAEVAQELGL